MNGVKPFGGRRERERRARQALLGIVRPQLLRADRDVLDLAVAAVGRGRHDGELPPAQFELLEDVMGRIPTYVPELGRVVSMNLRYCNTAVSRSNLMVKGRILAEASPVA
jgi:hypothetical protein